MQVINIDQNSDEWLEMRKGKITGSKMKNLVVKRGTGKKIGFYQLVADHLAIDENGLSSSRDRGHEFEAEAIKAFEEQTGKKVEQTGMWLSDENPDIAVSPDGAISVNGEYTEAVEVKCLSAANHLQVVIEDEVPNEYDLQVTQYFIVNEKLKTLYFVSYDPRVTAKPLHIIQVDREDREHAIKFYREYEQDTLKEINDIVMKLSF